MQENEQKALVENIKSLLSKLKGIISVSQIANKYMNNIIELENNYEKGGFIGLQNPGIRSVLQCNTVLAILKDSSFRPPPGSTVFMVEEQENENREADHLLIIDNNKYLIIGEELLEKTPPEQEEFIFISKDFILYPNRRKGRTDIPAFFIIPPLGFSELEEVKDLYKIDNIISVSPSSMADEYIRKLCTFSTDEAFATILIGFNDA
jgi:hypothetical protein